MNNATLMQIEVATNKYADEREELARLVRALTNEMEALKNRCLPGIKKAVAHCAGKHEALAALINSAPELFADPRTQTFHGVKVGFRKGAGKIDWDDDEKLADRIEKLLTEEEAELLINTKRTPVVKALKNLEVATLKRLGCTVESTGDIIVIKATDGEVEKIVNALLKDATEDQS